MKNRILSIALAIGMFPIGWFSSQPVFGAPTTNSMTQIGISASLFNDQNKVIDNGSYDIRFTIYTTDRKTADPYPSNKDARVWEETQKVDVKSGLIKTFLGSVVPFPATLNFQTGDYYVGIRIGTDSEMVPRKKLGSVPSAINSQYLQGKTIGINKGDIALIASTGTLDAAILKKINQVGTITSGAWQGTVIADSYIANALTGKTYNGINLVTTAGNHTLTLSTDVILDQNLSMTSDVIFNTLSLANALSPQNGGTGIATIPTDGQLLIGNGINYTLATLTAGTGMTVSNSPGAITLTNAGVTSLIGTTDQIIISGGTGDITLSLPQNIATTSSPTFSGLTLTGNLGMGSNTITSGLINGQTISSAANFTGTLNLGGNVLTSSGLLTITPTSGITINSAGQPITINSSTFDLNNTGAITIGTNGSAQDITFETQNFDVNSTGAVTIDGTNFTYTPTGTYTVTPGSTYTVNATGAVAIDSNASSTLSGAGVNLTSDGTNAITLTYASGGTFQLTDGTTRMEVAAGGNLTLGDSGATTTIDGTTVTLSGDTLILGQITQTIPDNTLDAFKLKQGSNNYLSVDTRNGAEIVTFGNTTTNPIYDFLGTGITTFAGNVDMKNHIIENIGNAGTDFTGTGGLTLAGNIDFNGIANDIAGTLNLSGGALTSTGAFSITPQAGQNLNVALSTTGDFAVNTNQLYVDTSTGNIGIGTAIPASPVSVGTANTSGTLLDISYIGNATLTGALIGARVDLNNGYVTPANQDIMGLRVVLPTTTNTNLVGTTVTMDGISLGYGAGTGINQNGAGTTIYSGVNLLMPALTQTLGSLIINGALITTSSSITTGGIANGINIAATGVGAGSLSGVNISSITGSSGTEVALNIGSGWDNVLSVNGTSVINGSGVVQVAAGGTGIASYTAGDILYASGTTAFTKLNGGAGNNGKVLVISGGIPTWGVMSGSSCTDCVLNDPTSATTQTIAPTGQSTSALILRQTSTASPNTNIFEVASSNGVTKYFYVDQNGNVSTGGIASQSITLTPTSDVAALTLVGTNVPTSNLEYINAKNTQGTIFNMAYGAPATLGGALFGEAINLATNVTATNQSVTGLSVTLPDATNTTSTSVYRGLSVSLPGGSGINQTGAGSTTFSGLDVAMPALTQTAGTLTANGALITTPASITTAGTASGVNIVATGVGAGALYGLNIGNITAGAGIERAINIGTGWDYGVYSATTGYSYFAGSVGIGTLTPGSALDVKGTLRLSGATSGYVGFVSPAIAGSTTYTLPSGDGTNGQALTTNGFGILSWTAGSSQWTTNGLDIYYNTGKVGIGIINPIATLDVVGNIKATQGITLGNSIDTTAGTIRWTGSDMQVYNGTAWKSMIAQDTFPDPFAFTNQTNIPLGTLATSEILQITGVDVAVTVAISGSGSPQFRICSDALCASVVQDWGSGVQTILDTQYLQLRLTSGVTSFSVNTASVTIGTGSDNWTVTTGDATPDAFSHTNVTGIELSTLTTSNIIQISGITIATAVSITGSGSPQFRICSDALCSTVVQTWGSAAQTITNSQYIQLRLTSSGSGLTSYAADVTIGMGTESWSVTTGDTTPDAFSYTDQSNVALSTLIMSNTLQISGINIVTPVSITGSGSPQFRTCSNSDCSNVVQTWETSGSITNSQYVQLRLTSSPGLVTTFSGVITVGAGSDSWGVTTGSDNAPTAFSYTDQTSIALSTLTTSNVIQITGLDMIVPVSITGSGSPQFRTCSNSDCSSVVQTWGSTTQTISSGQYLQLELTSSGSTVTAYSASVTVGTGSTNWSVTTGSAPLNTVAPVVTGTATNGQTLSCSTGTWTGTPTISYGYQWQYGTTNIGGATSSTYALTTAQVGYTIRCIVTGTSGWGSTTGTSNATSAVAPIVPGAPTIGTATKTGSTTATVSFTAPTDNGGATITTYTAYPSSGGGSGTLSQAGSGTISVTGLAGNTSYTFTVKATNSAGQSAASSASNSITTDMTNAQICSSLGGSYSNPTCTITYNPTSTGYSGTIQTWTVPSTGTYTIETFGARGGYLGGNGARMRGDFSLTSGAGLKILVGQSGATRTSDSGNGGSGGGGSFVTYSSNSPLIIAGGGGGGHNYSSESDGLTTQAGYGNSTIGSGGSSNAHASGGGGITGNGTSGSCSTGGNSFTNGGVGGLDSCAWGGDTGAHANGGFGAGGAAGSDNWPRQGGGGGYTGGNAGTYDTNSPQGGGGGSYNAGSNQSNTAGARNGAGLVTIAWNIGADLAENYPVSEPERTTIETDPTITPTQIDMSVTAGDIVSFDKTNAIHIIKSIKGDGQTFAGIISTSPGLVLVPDADPTTNRQLALAGRVPTKVTIENGPIAIGDRITISSTPGKGMKAKPLDASVGTAIESTNVEGTIIVFMDLQKATDTQAIGQELLTPSNLLSSPFSFVNGIIALIDTHLRGALATLGVSVAENGNLGIGTTSPDASLSIQGNTTTPLSGTVSVSKDASDVTGTETLFMSELSVGDTIKIGEQTFIVLTITDDTHLTLDTPHLTGAIDIIAYKDNTLLSINNSKGVNKLTIANNGNVGIGDSTPSALFTVGDGDLFQINAQGALTAKGITSTGGIVSLNDSSPFATNIGTGTSIGPITLGSGQNTFSLHSTTLDISTAGAITGATDITASGQIQAGDGIVTKVNAGICDDSAFTVNTDGTLCIDAVNGRIYYRYGGAWHYSAQTAGFQIPNYEAYSYDFANHSFDTSKPLSPNDFLIPFVENSLQDGALHGLYARFSDVKNTMFAEEKAQIADIIYKTDQNITTLAELQASVNTQLSAIGSDITQQLVVNKKQQTTNSNQLTINSQEETRLTDLETLTGTLQTNANTQISRIKTLEDQMTALMTFYTNANLGNIITKDADGNVDLTIDSKGLPALLGGKLKATILETGALSIDVIDPLAPTIGTAVIPAGETEVTVDTKAVTAKSKIFITPKADASLEYPLTILREIVGESFTVGIPTLRTSDINFDWWIIDKKESLLP